MFQAIITCDGERALISRMCDNEDSADFLGQLGRMWILSYGVKKEECVAYEVHQVSEGV